MFLNYLKIAYAVFLRRKFFTFINLFGITFTLAILMIVVAMLDHTFGENPPEVNQNRTLGIYRVNALATNEDGDNLTNSGMCSYHLIDEYLQDIPGVEVASYSAMFWKVLGYHNGQRIESFIKHTDANFWKVLKFEFVEGRPFTQDEFENADYVAVINEATKEKFFNGESAIGKTLETNNKRYRVVGVVKNIPILRFSSFSDIWVPQTLESDYNTPGQYAGFYTYLMMAKSRDDFPLIKEEIAARIDGIDLESSRYDRLVVVAESSFENLARLAFSQGNSTTDSTTGLYAVFVTLAILFMILPTVNMVNLNISRIMERASEIGVRKAFGAPSIILTGQFIVENVILTFFGGILALILTYVVLGIISAAGVIPYAHFTVNFRIFGIAMIMALFFGFFSGVYPAIKMSRVNPVKALQGGKS